jgi:hypothetical protein
MVIGQRCCCVAGVSVLKMPRLHFVPLGMTQGGCHSIKRQILFVSTRHDNLALFHIFRLTMMSFGQKANPICVHLG